METSTLDTVDDLARELEPPRCECRHGTEGWPCPDVAVFAVSLLCAEPGCDEVLDVVLLCEECTASWRRQAPIGPFAPRMRLERL